MLRVPFLSFVVVLALSLSAVWAPTAAAKRFHAYVSCGSGPSTRCYEGDLPVAVFRDSARDRTRYHMCVWGPNGKFRFCADRTARNRQSSYVRLFGTGIGWYRVKWWVHGKRIRTWNWYLASEGV